MRYRGYQISWWLILFELSLILGTGIFPGLIMKELSLSEPAMNIFLQMFTILPILTGCIILNRINKTENLREMIGFRTFDITMLLFFIIMPLSAQGFVNVVLAPVNYALTQVFGEASTVTTPSNMTEFFMLLLAVCVIAPVLEEILFRGIIMKLLAPYGFFIAALISSIAFAMLHLSPTGFFVILFLGVVMAVIRYISGSIFACMVFHAMNNFFSVMQLIFKDQIEVIGNVYVIFIIITGLIFPLIMLLYKKVYPAFESYSREVKGLGVSVGFILSIIFFVFVCFLQILNKFIL